MAEAEDGAVDGAMDGAVAAVLERYHRRMRREREERQSGGLGEDWRDRHLLAVGPATGRLLNILARSLEAPTILEIGTSFGYSGIWLAEAARATGGRLITLELAAHKQAQAREMAEAAGLAASIDFRLGDAVALIGALECRVDLVLLDLWKDLYVPCLEALLPKLNPGAILVADNMIRPPSEGARAYGARVRSLPGVGSLLLPVGSGIEVSRFPGG